MFYRLYTLDLNGTMPVILGRYPVRVNLAVHVVLHFQHGIELRFIERHHYFLHSGASILPTRQDHSYRAHWELMAVLGEILTIDNSTVLLLVSSYLVVEHFDRFNELLERSDHHTQVAVSLEVLLPIFLFRGKAT